MFAYCNNNPAKYYDESGSLPCQNTMRMSNDGGGAWSPNGIVPAKKRSSELKQFLSNADEQVVYEAEHYAFYNGTLVIRHSNEFLTSWAYGGVIFLNHRYDYADNRNELLRHEYGHILQEDDLGTIGYTLQVFIPSAIYNLISRNNWLSNYYYSMPWEYDANIRGNANLPHEAWAEDIANLYFSLWRWE